VSIGTLKLQDWIMTNDMARVDIAGLDTDRQIGTGGHCRTANINGVASEGMVNKELS